MNTILNEFYNYDFNDSYAFAGHRHGGFEINIVLEGEIEIVYDSSVLRLKKNDILLGAPFFFHRNKCIKDTKFVVFMFNCPKLFFKESFQLFKLSNSGRNLLKIIIEQESNSVNIQKLFDVFLDMILKESFFNGSGGSVSPVYTAAVEYMKNHLNENSDINEIAKVCGVCETTLKNTFKKNAGIGVNRYFTELKISKAYDFLKMGKSCAETAEILGFSSSAYFSYVFKSVTGKLPKSIKNQDI